MASECRGDNVYLKQSDFLKFAKVEERVLYIVKVAAVAQVIATIATTFFLKNTFLNVTSLIVGGAILATSVVVSAVLLALTFHFHQRQEGLINMLKDAEWVRLPADHGVKALSDSPEPH